MRLLAIATGVACLAAASAAGAQEAALDRPSIVVTGSGEAESVPDTFTVTAGVEGRGSDQIAALQELAARQRSVMDGLRRLEGLTRSELTTGEVKVEGAYDPACGGSGYDRDTTDCPVVGYVASMDLTLRASPVDRAGDAVSLAAELGARGTSISWTGLEDMSALRQQANEAAFADARRQADVLAAASGQRIVRVLRIQDPSARAITIARDEATQIDEVVVVGVRARPRISLEVAPPPVSAESRVTVFFEIE